MHRNEATGAFLHIVAVEPRSRCYLIVIGQLCHAVRREQIADIDRRVVVEVDTDTGSFRDQSVVEHRLDGIDNILVRHAVAHYILGLCTRNNDRFFTILGDLDRVDIGGIRKVPCDSNRASFGGVAQIGGHSEVLVSGFLQHHILATGSDTCYQCKGYEDI